MLRRYGERHLSLMVACTQDDHGRTVPKTVMVSMVEFFAADVAIGGCNQLGIALHLEVEIVVGTEHAAPFSVDSMYADVLQIGAVGKPMAVSPFAMLTQRSSASLLFPILGTPATM